MRHQLHGELRVIEPDPATGLEQPSAAQCQDLRAVSSARVVNGLGNMGTLVLAQIRETFAVIITCPEPDDALSCGVAAGSVR